MSCPNLVCRQPLSAGSIAAQLEVQIRNCIGKFYEAWLVCDDASCRTRTRMMSVYGRRCLNTSLACKGVMSYEVSHASHVFIRRSHWFIALYPLLLYSTPIRCCMISYFIINLSSMQKRQSKSSKARPSLVRFISFTSNSTFRVCFLEVNGLQRGAQIPPWMLWGLMNRPWRICGPLSIDTLIGMVGGLFQWDPYFRSCRQGCLRNRQLWCPFLYLYIWLAHSRCCGQGCFLFIKLVDCNKKVERLQQSSCCTGVYVKKGLWWYVILGADVAGAALSEWFDSFFFRSWNTTK